MTSDHAGCTSANQIQSWRSTDERSDIQEHPDAPYPFGLLRARRQRPRRRATEQRDELAPPHAEHGAPSQVPLPIISVGTAGRRRFDASGAHVIVGDGISCQAAYCTYEKSPRVTFKMLRIAENDWQIAAECPGTETHYIKGLNSKADVDEWLAGTRRIAWLRSQGYAK